MQFASLSTAGGHINRGDNGDGSTGEQIDNNPYSRDAQHIKEAIHFSQSIVRLCSSFQNNTEEHIISVSGRDVVVMKQEQLGAALDRLGGLLTPDEEDVNPSSQQMNINGLSSNNYSAGSVAAGGASYDSSMVGMAANAILSQFMDEEGVVSSSSGGGGGGANNLAVLLANSLGHIVSSTQQLSANHDSSSNLQIKAAIVLNQLAATDPPPPQQLTESAVLGAPASATRREIPTSWCHVIVNSPTVLSSLLQQLPSRFTTNSITNITLCEKCVFVIGNLLGDSFMARQALIELGALSNLIACVRLGLARLRLLGQHQQQVDVLAILQLLRNSIWSLINFIRGGDDTSSPSFLTEIQGVGLAVLLSLPESIQSITNNVECIGSSFDVAIEACWLIVVLTNNSNNDEAATFVIENCVSNEVLLGLLTRLSSGAGTAMIRFKQVGGGQVSSTLTGTGTEYILYGVANSSIPCCRALANIAIYLDSIFTLGETQTKQSVTAALLSDTTAKSLVELISLGSIGGGTEASTIACSATSLAGICLAEASHEFERYAASPIWSLLPALVQGLIGPLSTFNFRREVVRAIWDMLQHNRLQNRLLMEIIGTSTPEEVAKSLTDMLTTLESSDAIEPSLGLVDMLLRILDYNEYRARTNGKRLKILFEEVGLVDALWYVCDNDVDESDVAEKAAELIDDFYGEQEEDEDGADEMVTAPSVVTEQQFQFQAPSNTGQFNFTG